MRRRWREEEEEDEEEDDKNADSLSGVFWSDTHFEVGAAANTGGLATGRFRRWRVSRGPGRARLSQAERAKPSQARLSRRHRRVFCFSLFLSCFFVVVFFFLVSSRWIPQRAISFIISHLHPKPPSSFPAHIHSSSPHPPHPHLSGLICISLKACCRAASVRNTEQSNLHLSLPW